jgi:hypothetical protein
MHIIAFWKDIAKFVANLNVILLTGKTTMPWNKEEKYIEVPNNKESELENAVNEVKGALFGSTRIYLDDKKKNRSKGWDKQFT